MKHLLFLSLVFGYASTASAENLFTREYLWKACHYYDVEKQEVIKEDCMPTQIKFSSCENNVCYFQAFFDHQSRDWCSIWGKVAITSDSYAQGEGIATYYVESSRYGDLSSYEDCELSFDITKETMAISIISGCSKACTPDKFEFGDTYYIGFLYRL